MKQIEEKADTTPEQGPEGAAAPDRGERSGKVRGESTAAEADTVDAGESDTQRGDVQVRQVAAVIAALGTVVIAVGEATGSLYLLSIGTVLVWLGVRRALY